MLNKEAYNWAISKIENGEICYRAIPQDAPVNKNFRQNYICKIVSKPDENDPRDWAYDVFTTSGKLSFQKLYVLISLAKEDGEFEVSEACSYLINKISKLSACCA